MHHQTVGWRFEAAVSIANDSGCGGRHKIAETGLFSQRNCRRLAPRRRLDRVAANQDWVFPRNLHELRGVE